MAPKFLYARPKEDHTRVSPFPSQTISLSLELKQGHQGRAGLHGDLGQSSVGQALREPGDRLLWKVPLLQELAGCQGERTPKSPGL